MVRQFNIDGTHVHDDGDCYVIAEIGHNHQGKLEKAFELFRRAKDAGADAVKLQKRDNRGLFTRTMYHAPYDNPNSFGATYGEHREYLEFDEAQYRELMHLARELDITFFSTPFDIASADFLANLDMPAYKIASGDLRNTPLIEHVAKFGKPMIISTGGGDMDDVRRAHDAARRHTDELCIMQCTSAYPCAVEELNLRVIDSFAREFPNIVVGYSGHDNGIAMSVVAYMLGARVVEKHFTLDRSMKGTDHAFSLAPTGLQHLVRDLRRARIALGNGVKAIHESERSPLRKMGKMLVAARDLPEGHVLVANDVAIKSPADGLPPYELDGILGKRLGRAMLEDEPFSFDLLG